MIRETVWAAVRFQRDILAVLAVAPRGAMHFVRVPWSKRQQRFLLEVAENLFDAAVEGEPLPAFDGAVWNWRSLPWYRRAWYWAVSAW
jgi:hypothetical protein